MASAHNVFDHELEAIKKEPAWEEIFMASHQLTPQCEACEYRHACGGGPMQMRWSDEKRYNNSSVYCEDIKKILKFAEEKIAKDLYVKSE